MDPIIIAIIMIMGLFAFILLGVHIGVALATLSVGGVWWIYGDFFKAFGLLSNTAFSAIMDYGFGVLPMFILMGVLVSLSGAGEELYRSANMIFARVRGGVGITTVFANAIFAAVTGVSVASAAVFSKIAIPEMKQLKYNDKFSLGIVSGSSLLGMLIPPSALLILYGILAEESIGKLFMAGIGPGILLTIMLGFGVYGAVLIRPEIGGQRPNLSNFAGRDIMKITLAPWAIYLLLIVVLGGIYGGFFTATEAGGIGAFGAFCILILKRKFTFDRLWQALLETGYTTASICFLIISAQMYSKMLTISGLAYHLSNYIISLSVSPIIIICLFAVIFMLLGCILDSASIMLVCLPVMLPVIQVLGIDLLWFGIISLIAIEAGLITPPFGMVAFAMKATLGPTVQIEDIFIGSLYFLLIILIFFIIILIFPPLTTWIPSHLGVSL